MNDEESARYRVVFNTEGQYSIWPTDRELPPGWWEEGTIGSRSACLARIDQVWTDMRPSSLRTAEPSNERSTERVDPQIGRQGATSEAAGN